MISDNFWGNILSLSNYRVAWTSCWFTIFGGFLPLSLYNNRDIKHITCLLNSVTNPINLGWKLDLKVLYRRQRFYWPNKVWFIRHDKHFLTWTYSFSNMSQTFRFQSIEVNRKSYAQSFSSYLNELYSYLKS